MYIANSPWEFLFKILVIKVDKPNELDSRDIMILYIDSVI